MCYWGCLVLTRGFAAWDHDELDTAYTEKQHIERGTVNWIVFFQMPKNVKVVEDESPWSTHELRVT